MYMFLFGMSVGYFLSGIADLKTIVSLVLKKICIPSSLVKISRKIYRLDYTYNGKLYHLFLNIRHGPKTLIRVTDEGHFDVTNRVLPFLGPSENAHKLIYPITPNNLGYERLEFITIKGDSICFNKDEEINI